MAFVAGCKPVGTSDDSTLMENGKKTAILDLAKASCELMCARIENRAVLAFVGVEEPAADTQVKFGDVKLLWSFSKYLMKRKARKDVKVSEKKDAGSKLPAPSDTGAKTTSGSGFFGKHFSLSSAGLVMSTSNNIRERLKTGGKDMDDAQIKDAKVEQADKKDFYVKPDASKGPKLTTA